MVGVTIKKCVLIMKNDVFSPSMVIWIDLGDTSKTILHLRMVIGDD